MEIENNTSFPEALMLGNGPDGFSTLTVIIKATFQFPQDSSKNATIASDQLPIAATDEFYDDDMQRGVRIEGDMVLFKSKADIVLVGTAYAPKEQAVSYCDTGLRVGKRVKKVRVYGERDWHYGSKVALTPSITRPQFFVTMELTYERAFGGIDESQGMLCKYNLLGKGYAGKKKTKSLHHKPLPNLEDPNNLIKSWDTHPMPAGYGFWPKGCLPRSKYAGTFDEKWKEERASEMPQDFSFNFFNAAHPDLQVEGYLQGDEEVEMLNLTPQGHIKFQLSGLYPKITIIKNADNSNGNSSVSGKKEEGIKPNLDTICFLPDEGIFYQVWRGLCQVKSLACEEIKEIIISKN